MSRRCSHCGHDGHNSRTCLDRGGGTGGGFKLFGVQVAETPSPPASVSSSSPSASPSPGKTATATSAPIAAAAAAAIAMRKSFSMGNLSNYGSSEGASPCGVASSPPEHPDLGEGYASDDVVHTNCSSSARERKKGVPWTEEEHRSFLLGLRKLGKGDWRGISRNFVKTRTPTQVASHAQKYFLRRNNLNKRRRRSSLFDITPDTVSSLLEESVMEDPEAEASHELNFESTGQRMQASLALSRNAHLDGFKVPPSSFKFPCMPMSAPSNMMEDIDNGSEANELKDSEITERTLLQPLTGMAIMETVPEGNDDMGDGPVQVPLSFPVIPIWPVPGYYWPDCQAHLSSESKVVKPTPIIPVPPSKIDETIRLSELSLNCTRPVMEPTPLSYQLLEEGSRQSAFHSMPSTTSTDVEKKGSLTNAISVP